MPSVTLSYDAAQATRIAAALGKSLGLRDVDGVPRPATGAEYKAWLSDVTKRLVMGQELADAHAAIANPADVPIT